MLLFLILSCEKQTASDPPVADFTADKTTIAISESVQFTDQSTNKPGTWNWDFGDGNASTEKNPAHEYTNSGTFDVSLTAINEIGSDTESKPEYILVISDDDSVTDIDGNKYNTVRIGKQLWMGENLKVTHYSDGNGIPIIESYSAWKELEVHDKAYCVYDNDSSYAEVYGLLYTWTATMNGAESSIANPSGVQGVCPAGWHVPSDAEFNELFDYLVPFLAGGKLKEEGTTHWNSPNEGASDETGFTALPGGYQNNYTGSSHDMGYSAKMWTSSEKSSVSAWFRSLYHVSSSVGTGSIHKAAGFSVRCVRD